MTEKITSMEDLTYEWPPNIGHYEAKVLAGMTMYEAMAGAMGFLIPVAVLNAPLVVSAICGVVAFTFVKRFERFGGVALPVYLFYRFQASRSNEILELPLITSGTHGTVEIEDWEGETVAVME